MTYGALKVHVLVWLKRRLYAKTQGKYTEGNSTLLQLETLPPDKCHRCVYIHLRQYNNSTLQGKLPHPSSQAELLYFPFFFLLCIASVNSFWCRQSLSGKHANSNSYSCSIIPHTQYTLAYCEWKQRLKKTCTTATSTVYREGSDRFKHELWPHWVRWHVTGEVGACRY